MTESNAYFIEKSKLFLIAKYF